MRGYYSQFPVYKKLQVIKDKTLHSPILCTPAQAGNGKTHAMPKTTSSDGLTAKQRLFIDSYVECTNGANAARLAGYSVANARQIAYRLLQRPLIAQAIEAGVERKLREARLQFIIDRDRRMGVF